DARDLGEPRQDRVQRRSAHLDRLLHHVIKAGVLERRKHISEIRKAILRPRTVLNFESIRALAAGARSPPFAVAAVEHQDRAAKGQPEYITEVVALVAVERDSRAGA